MLPSLAQEAPGGYPSAETKTYSVIVSACSIGEKGSGALLVEAALHEYLGLLWARVTG